MKWACLVCVESVWALNGMGRKRFLYLTRGRARGCHAYRFRAIFREKLRWDRVTQSNPQMHHVTWNEMDENSRFHPAFRYRYCNTTWYPSESTNFANLQRKVLNTEISNYPECFAFITIRLKASCCSDGSSRLRLQSLTNLDHFQPIVLGTKLATPTSGRLLLVFFNHF